MFFLKALKIGDSKINCVKELIKYLARLFFEAYIKYIINQTSEQKFIYKYKHRFQHKLNALFLYGYKLYGIDLKPGLEHEKNNFWDESQNFFLKIKIFLVPGDWITFYQSSQFLI